MDIHHLSEDSNRLTESYHKIDTLIRLFINASIERDFPPTAEDEADKLLVFRRLFSFSHICHKALTDALNKGFEDTGYRIPFDKGALYQETWAAGDRDGNPNVDDEVYNVTCEKIEQIKRTQIKHDLNDLSSLLGVQSAPAEFSDLMKKICPNIGHI